MNGLNVSRRIGAIAEGVANLSYGACERVIGNKLLFPDLLEQLRFFHDSVAVLD